MLLKDRIFDFMKDSGLDAVFVQKNENCYYISRFTGSDSFLFLTKDADYLLTDSRYTEQAKQEAVGFEVINHAGKLPSVIAELAQKHKVKRIGVESPFSYSAYLSFSAVMDNVEFKVCALDNIRQIKTQEELKCIAEACRISDEGFKKTIPYIKPGVTERELMAVLESSMLLEGSEGKSFDTIVASGYRGAYPHGIATDKVIESGDLITFDFGAIYKGYHSDITRTVAVGEISDQQQFMYDKVLGCVEYIEGLLKAGETASDVDHLAREYLKKFSLDSYFTHALGHSVGLEIHEAPVLAPRDHSVLMVGMTETVEPGVYIPGVGGVRIEDTVTIEKDGISVLTKFPKKFLRV
ncbi:Xaa-Pro peptidase family protein [uncultured Dialister sp.]|uniref:M24 family metallopeptidase n=1 Tax=Dialister hominis TaxID=2582419 RepID=UPI0026DD73E0|nr:Xaa-Pro peptidase family protein [uncultured Dialister sp.]